INCNDPSCSCFSGINNNNNIVPTQTSILPNHNNNQPSEPNNTSNNNPIISPGHNYQQSNDASNNKVTPSHNYQQLMPNNASFSQPYPQYIDGMITINSPQTY